MTQLNMSSFWSYKDVQMAQRANQIVIGDPWPSKIIQLAQSQLGIFCWPKGPAKILTP